MKGGRCSKKGTERTHTPWVTPSSRRQVGCSVTSSQQSCSGFLGLRRASSGENWGFVAFGVFVFLITTSRSHFLWAYIVRLGQPELGLLCGKPCSCWFLRPSGPSESTGSRPLCTSSAEDGNPEKTLMKERQTIYWQEPQLVEAWEMSFLTLIQLFVLMWHKLSSIHRISLERKGGGEIKHIFWGLISFQCP